MQQYLSINWSEPTEIEGVNYPEDNLDRQKYAQYLSNFLAAKGYDSTKTGDDGKHNYVLNLNSEWGSGKTYFLKRWSKSLEGVHPVVYVDAWQQDYSDDPLMAVIASMIHQLRVQAGKSAEDPMFKAPRKLLGLLKSAVPAVAGGLTKRYLGIDPVKIMESSEKEDIGETIKDDNGEEMDMGAAASKMVSHLINEHAAKSQAIESLKYTIEQWVAAAKSNNNDKNYPAFVFIDELDRCRPSYAVEMLETIKHIFDIPGVVFVVATDTTQLQHAVKAIYGTNFNADLYLNRFFDARYSLKEMPYDELLATHCDMEALSFSTLEQRGIQAWPICIALDEEKRNIAAIYQAFGLQAREAIQVTERLISVLNGFAIGQTINIYFLIILMCFSVKHRTLYEKMQNKSLSSKDMSSTLLEQINSTLNWNGFSLRLQVLPKQLVKYFETGNSGYTNHFVNGTYEVQISDFFAIMQKAIFDHPGSIRVYKGAWDRLASISASIPNGYQTSSKSWEEETQFNIKDWLIIMAHNSKRGNFEFDFYKDLVELSIYLET